MRRFVVTLATAVVFVAGAPIMGANVGAAPIVAPGAIRAAADSLNVVESVQFIWLGHDYCWYDDGWNGPGWYWCDYGNRIGLGWGGGYGWHNWRGGHPGGKTIQRGDHNPPTGDHKAPLSGKAPSGSNAPTGSKTTRSKAPTGSKGSSQGSCAGGAGPQGGGAGPQGGGGGKQGGGGGGKANKGQ